MSTPYYNSELYHHGVKGMKWGVRRYQNKDGTRTPEGKKRYSNNGDETDKPQKKSLTTKQKVAVGAAAATVAVAAIGAMYVYKKKHVPTHIATYEYGKIKDLASMSTESQTIPKGTKFHRFSSKSFEDYAAQGSRIYAAHEKKDVRLYKETMPKFIRDWGKAGAISDDGSKMYEHVMKAKQDIRVASERATAEAYMRATGETKVDAGKFRSFMIDMVDRHSESAQKFQKALSDMGFNAVLDTNDSQFARSPLILFDPGSILDTGRSHYVGAVEKVINTLLM